jgi:hypothetical protein
MFSETVTLDEHGCNALPRISDAVSPGLNEYLDGIRFSMGKQNNQPEAIW